MEKELEATTSRDFGPVDARPRRQIASELTMSKVVVRLRVLIRKNEPIGRVRWIDMAKGVGIALVTFVHIPNGDGVDVWLPAIDKGIEAVGLFHMPLFFMLSGLTFSSWRKPLDFIIHKAKTLLIPYAVYSLYALAKPLVVLFVPSLSGAVGSTHEYSIVGQLFDVIVAGNGLWFLMALFVGEVVVYVIERRLSRSRLDDTNANKVRLVLGTLLVLMASFRSTYIVLPFDPFQLFAGLRATGFMLVTLAIKERVVLAEGGILRALVPAAVLAVVVVSLGNSSILDVMLKAVAAFAGALAIMFACQSVSGFAPLEYVGRNSLTYYVVNALTMNVLKLIVFQGLGIDATLLPGIAQYLFALGLITVAFVALALESEFIKRFLWWTIGRPSPAEAAARKRDIECR